MIPVEQENDSLSSLEERIRQAVDLVVRLRKERDAAVQEAAQVKADAATALDEIKRLQDENRSLQAERKQVRGRIEKLLGQIDQLSAG